MSVVLKLWAGPAGRNWMNLIHEGMKIKQVFRRHRGDRDSFKQQNDVLMLKHGQIFDREEKTNKLSLLSKDKKLICHVDCQWSWRFSDSLFKLHF